MKQDILTLGLAIGVNSTIFSVVYGVALRQETDAKSISSQRRFSPATH